MLDYFEHFFDREVLDRLEPSILSTPRQRRSILAIGFKLKKAVVDAIEEDLVVYMLALCQEGPGLNDLGRLEVVFLLGRPLVFAATL